MGTKIHSVAILGVGARGGSIYGRLINEEKEHFKIVSLCDLRQEKLNFFGEVFGVENAERFTDEDAFFEKKRADLLVIATQDKDHIRHCLKAFEKGYDVLLEKPISDKIEECEQLLKAQKQYGCKVLVCHVLRYAPAFKKVKELIDNGEIGKLIMIDALEGAAYWHYAHSYIRGNWRNSKISSPMILAKCCHDMDLLQYYAGSRCENVASIGDLAFFKEENSPSGAAKRCTDCQYVETCPYSAKRFYIDRWVAHGEPKDCWPHNVIANAPLSKEKLWQAIKEGPYGKCVFACDNDVVDHQITQMTFINGVKATLTMTGFQPVNGRKITFHGTLGTIYLDEPGEKVVLHKYGENETEREIDFTLDGMNEYGHGGGDKGMIDDLIKMLDGGELITSLEESLESHLMALRAEESRLRGGECIRVHVKSI